MILFGTGGIRGIMKPGEFDESVVIRASKAFGLYIKESGGPERVVIAHDTRRKSREFALLSANVLAGLGLKVSVFPEDAPTPLLSFACRRSNSFGVVITASHNPKEYNGYKIYTPDGVQAVPEVTDRVSELFLRQDENFRSGRYDILTRDLEEEYIRGIIETVEPPSGKVKVIYTPLHGTGRRFVPRVLEEMGIDVSVVKEQMIPDGNFPTVEVPNPESESALRILKENMTTPSIGLATDPDSDRLGVLVKNDTGIFRLDGNQIGVLLTDFLTSGELPENPLVIKTIVTTNMVKVMGRDKGFSVEETPTGFKFIGKSVVEHERSGDASFVFGFEESYGYLTGDLTRDKDGVLAAALVTSMASRWDILKRMEELYEEYGYHLQRLINLEVESPEIAVRLYESVKEKPDEFFPGIEDFIDYSKGVGGVIPNETVKISLRDGDIFIRPSGTEPKLKIYLMTVGESEKLAIEKLNRLEALVRNVESRTRDQSQEENS